MVRLNAQQLGSDKIWRRTLNSINNAHGVGFAFFPLHWIKSMEILAPTIIALCYYVALINIKCDAKKSAAVQSVNR
ncbi:hypothetical protein V8C35DRAFT_306107 [Trichoderma chlorosporum]